jgi:hypothetical protein
MAADDGELGSAASPETAEHSRPDHMSSGGRRLSDHFSELGDYATYFVRAKLDGARVSVRNAVIWTAVGVVALVVLFAMLATSVVLLIGGISEGLGVLFGDRLWLGRLATGLLGLAILGGSIALGIIRVKASMRMKRIRQYEEYKALQRARHGRDVTQTGHRGNGSQVSQAAGG